MKQRAFLSATRSFMHANIFFNHYKDTSTNVPFDDLSFFVTPKGTYMLMWLGLLYNVCEYLSNVGVLPASIKTDFKTISKDFQNCRRLTFHIQPEFYTERHFALLASNEARDKASRINIELKRFFDQRLADLKQLQSAKEAGRK